MSIGTPVSYSKKPARSAAGAWDIQGLFSLDASRRIILPAMMAVLAIIGWEIVVDVAQIPTFILAPPTEIFDKIVRFYPLLLKNAVPTTVESLIAFALTVLLGVSLAAVMVYSKLAYDTLYPNVVFFQLIPKIALAPLFIMWFGVEYQSRLAFSIFISFFPMLVATSAGLGNVDNNLIRLCRSLGASKWQILWSIRFPASIPFIFSGMKVSITLSVIGIIVGEFIASQAGLGYLILFASGRQDTALTFAAVTVLCLVGLVMYACIVVCELIITRWLVSTVTR